MFNTYADKGGFSIRKSTMKYRLDKSLFKKYIVCSSQGHRQTESSKDTTRSACTARIQFNITREGVWMAQKIVHRHNHYLASLDRLKNLRSQRRVTEADKKQIGQIWEAGMWPSPVFEFMKQFY
jgi:ribosomal protein L35